VEQRLVTAAVEVRRLAVLAEKLAAGVMTALP
jgi:hypothetical protein